jgi:hypothetical protein
MATFLQRLRGLGQVGAWREGILTELLVTSVRLKITAFHMDWDIS